MPGWWVIAACPFGARVVSVLRRGFAEDRLQSGSPPVATLWDHFHGICPQPGSVGTAGARGRSPVPGIEGNRLNAPRARAFPAKLLLLKEVEKRYAVIMQCKCLT